MLKQVQNDGQSSLTFPRPCLIAPRKRVKTKPSRAAKAKRVDEKKGRSEVKKGRAKVRLD